MQIWDEELTYMANIMIKQFPFKNNHENICYVFENSRNIYYDYYVEVKHFTNYTIKKEFEKIFTNESQTVMENAMDTFNQHYLTKSKAFWASFFGPAYSVGCAMASYDIEDINNMNEIIQHNGMYCFFKTIEENYDEYIVGKPCSLCISQSCNSIYTNLCD